MNALIIFVKNPQLGKVKTRLASSLGDEKALEVYKSLLQYTKVVSSLISAKRYVYYSEHLDPELFPTKNFTQNIQQGKDLGARMSNAFEQVLQTHDKAVIIGSDCPLLTPFILSEAYSKLENHDLVIGPSIDGGYYMLGMKEHHSTLFDGIDWSTDGVYRSTVDKIQELELTLSALEPLPDIDYEEDWNKYGWVL